MDKSGNKIGIIGGTFDPVHTGHLIIAEKAREEFGLEKVFFIPAGIPPHKKIFFAPAFQRLKMIEMAIESNPFFEALSIEMDVSKPSYTFDTVSLMERDYPFSMIHLIVGEDAFRDLPTWRNYQLLVKKVIFLVARREADKPFKFLDTKGLRYNLIDSPYMEISSSYIRNCLNCGKTVKYLIPDKVIEYIRRNELYGFENDKGKN
ncbi:MAG TPA: nicotinate (nicotinamide) nucleotide adenylyltransferase [bacterium]|nr:nicotinate (nicotinamide) nucleotide adenylyltransferase [bacterium]